MMFSMNKSSFLSIDTVILFSIIFILLSIILFIIFFALKNKMQGKRIKILGAWVFVWLLVGFILFNTGYFGRFINVESANKVQYNEEELSDDLQQIENSIMKENPLFFVDKNKVKKSFAATYDKIEDGMTELQFYRLINPVITGINCGHTNLSISKGLQQNREENAKFFPLKVTLVNNELFVLEDYNNEIKAGYKIISINGKNSEQIIKKLIENISGDGIGETKQRYIISKYFNSRFYDFVDNSDSFNIKYINSDGNIDNDIIAAKYNNDFNVNAWGIHSDPYKNGNYYGNSLYDDYALLNLNVFMKEREDNFNDFLKEFFLELKEKKISKLIIDLRGNFGGSPQMSKKLLSYLVNKETKYFTGDLPFLQSILGFTDPIVPNENRFEGETIIITDGSNFSTAAHFISMVKYHKLGILLGSKTGGSYVCTDSSKDIVLNNTRMRLHYSTLVYELEVEGLPQNKGIAPDIYVSQNIDNILSGKDLALEKALQVLEIN